jgi:hypothetical protein
MGKVNETHRQMLDQSLKNIDSLLEGEKNQDIVDFLKVAKQSLQCVKDRIEVVDVDGNVTAVIV